MHAPALTAPMIARLVAVCVLPVAFLAVPAALTGAAPAPAGAQAVARDVTQGTVRETMHGAAQGAAEASVHVTGLDGGSAKAPAPGYGMAGCGEEGCATPYCPAPAASDLDGYAVPCPRQG